jgi:hypothetical protein
LYVPERRTRSDRAGFLALLRAEAIEPGARRSVHGSALDSGAVALSPTTLLAAAHHLI